VGETTYRVRRLYRASCAIEFDNGSTGIYRILASRHGTEPALTLTRDDLYAPPEGEKPGAAFSAPAP
jgi:cyclopropane-fatty-acyl-phospholipid synthase